MTITIVANPTREAAATFRLFFREAATDADRATALITMLGWFEEGKIDGHEMHTFLDIAEAPDVVLVAAITAHYRAPDGPRWPKIKFTPQAICEALRRTAARGEEAAEVAHLCCDYALGWLGYAGAAVQLRYLELIDADPAEFAWVCSAYLRETKALAPETLVQGARLAVALTHRPDVPPRLACTLAAACLCKIEDAADVAGIVCSAAESPGFDVAPGLLQNLATAAAEQDRASVWEAATDRLIAIASRETEEAPQRVRAALRALVCASIARHTPMPYASVVAAIADMMGAAPFREDIDLRTNLRRHGVELDPITSTSTRSPS